jgi:DNA-binding GntR family transcriptional regulator
VGWTLRQGASDTGSPSPESAPIYSRLDMRTSKTRTKQKPAVAASKRAEEYLRNAIYAGKLRPMQRIIEEDLARELNISRSPVREAILRLERDGLVVNTPRHGTFIRDISLDEIDAIFRVRAKLEGLCAYYMRQNSSVDAAMLLNQALNKLIAAAETNDDEQFFQADIELHRTIWQAANRPLIYRLLNLSMNPYISFINRVYSYRFAMTARRDIHEKYVQIVLETPLDEIEKEVEQYFAGVKAKLFGRSASVEDSQFVGAF